eukprot:gene18392-22511_t
MKLAVCIPCYNEANYLATTLTSLSSQVDRDFTVFVCDNGSTDETAWVARTTAAALGLDLEVVEEAAKGTGAAADTAFRAAIAQGFELLARTDADAIVDPSWTRSIREHFAAHPRGLASGVTGPIVGELTALRSLTLRAASAL